MKKILIFIFAIFLLGCNEDEGERIMREAQKGNAESQFLVGANYYIVDNDIKNAVEWLEKASSQGYIDAENLLIKIYVENINNSNLSDPEEYIEKKAKKGNVFAQRYFGMINKARKLYSDAIYWLEKAAEKDDNVSMYLLGEYYCYEEIQSNSTLEKATEWFKKSAEKGMPESQYLLGECYLLGEGVEQSDEKAFELYKKSAEQGYINAQFKMGFCYEEGIGVIKDVTKSNEWYLKANRQAFAEGICQLGKVILTRERMKKYKAFFLKEEDTLNFLDNYSSLGLSCITKAAKMGNVEANYELGYYYLENKDVFQAYNYLSEACKNDFKDSCIKLEKVKKHILKNIKTYIKKI